jgi:hypothetical protein
MPVEDCLYRDQAMEHLDLLAMTKSERFIELNCTRAAPSPASVSMCPY